MRIDNLLHLLIGFQSLLLVLEEDTHGRNHLILLVRVDEEPAALCLKRVDEMHVHSAIAVRHMAAADFNRVAPDVMEGDGHFSFY
jgi:hypothetical protein